MITSRERVRRALRRAHPDRAPRELWALPGIEMFRKDELNALLEQYPSDFAAPDVTTGAGPDVRYGTGYRTSGTPNMIGTYVDEWGCPFVVAEHGVIGEVKEPPLADWSALDDLRPPDEILVMADFSKVDAACAATDKYVKAGTTVRPFERMQFLRGSEALYMDLASGVPEVFRLRDLVHEFFLREIELWTKTDVDAISFMDDWGSQERLLISPTMWREIFRPLYKEYIDMIHAAGKDVFFHSDGYIIDIIPDLIELGVDALNSQLFCMNIEEIGRRFQGQITFWGEIDRQWTLPFGSEDDVRNAVRRVRAALDDGQGGVIAQCEWGNDVRRENIAAVFEAWLEPTE
ncbi:MAG: uroporphyrinogen decarboxylase family protein [Caldilineaceae bacterium]